MSDTITISLPVAEAKKLKDATDAAYLIDAAARVFGLIRTGLVNGFLTAADEATIDVLAELAERALEDVARTEGDTLSSFSMKLDRALDEAGAGEDAA